MCVPSLEAQARRIEFETYVEEQAMLIAEPFLQAELEYRRNRIDSTFPKSARRRRTRRLRRRHPSPNWSRKIRLAT